MSQVAPTHTSLIADEPFFEALVRDEYARLREEGHVYLDYTGGNLYASSQLQAHHALLNTSTFGNPHSTNPTSQHSTKLVEAARQHVLEYFNASDYFCVFTQNASGALKIVGECFPWSRESRLLLLRDNHNSVNGIREFCKQGGGSFEYAPLQYEDLRIDAESLRSSLRAYPDSDTKLFAFPAQSNVSGVQHSLEWVREAKVAGWDVLLDAAAFVPTSRLDLSTIQPDFVAVSFYKIFGYPTGLGCLLIHKDAFPQLRKPWFAGGTVTLASTRAPHHYLAGNHERFEDGTINYLDIPAISIGLQYIEKIGIERISQRVKALTHYLMNGLLQLRYTGGEPMVRLFGPSDRTQTGGTIIMNFLDKEGNTYPFEEFEQEANQRKISIRSGCFCNPGIDEINHAISAEELTAYFTSRDQGSYTDMVEFLSKMRGATRVSVGIATLQQDLDTFLAFVKEFLLQQDSAASTQSPLPSVRRSVKKFERFSILGTQEE